jgi:prepilin-type N-terminal cleavage/methylation domain-containing protein/prepilin-type processing-associated H-X9-DG protein
MAPCLAAGLFRSWREEENVMRFTNRRFSSRRCSGAKPGRAGFTLVELLVVITIIGMLMAMVMPALGTAFEIARQATCAARMSQIGKAVSTYKVSFQCLPPGQPNCMPAKDHWKTGSKKEGAECMGPNWLSLLLSSLGEQKLSDGLKRCLMSTDERLTCMNTCEDAAQPEFDGVGTQILENTLVCPSAEVMNERLVGGKDSWGLEGLAKGNYAANFGAATFNEAIISGDLAEEQVRRKLRGPFMVVYVQPTSNAGGKQKYIGGFKAGYKLGFSEKDLRDGAGKTMMVSEVMGYDSGQDGRGVWANSSMGASIFTAKTPPNASGQNNKDYFDHIQICDESINEFDPMHCVEVRDQRSGVWAAARSAHLDTINVLFCDSHVESVETVIDVSVWQAQATIAGNE